MEGGGGSRIFVGCRSVGTVSGSVGLVARYIKRRRETLLVTVVDKCFLTYGADHFSLLSVSGRHPGDIVALAADSYHVYTACGKTAYAWRRGTELKHTYDDHSADVRLLLPFATLLLTVDDNDTLTAWRIKEEEKYIEIPFDSNRFRITTIAHPATYLNKVLLGSKQGALQLWNVKTSKLIHSFAGWNSSVTALEQAPAVDVTAIGLADGSIVLHNLKADATVVRFQGRGAVTSISFRTDGFPVMVTGCPRGHLTFWNLEQRRVAHQIKRAHGKAVAGLVCFPNEPILATNSPDNSLKLWIFDMSDGGARLLRIREGHSAPPTFIRYIETEGSVILTAGADSSMRILSSAAGHHPASLGTASFNREVSKKKKHLREVLTMPAITQFSCSMQRDKQWDSVAAVHGNMNVTTTWSLHKKKMGAHKLSPEGKAKGVSATCLTVSHCGNFVFIGYSSGQVYKFNMQSGLIRGRWGGNSSAHSGPVRGVETDNLNQRLFTAGSDGRLKLWPFDEAKVPLKVLKLQEMPSFTRYHRESSLLCLCNEDFTMIILDTDTANVVRKFEGHSSKINDACFARDGRWLISAGMDRTVQTWDIPTGQLIDIFKVDFPCTSLDMSISGDFLVTSHVGQIGVCLWANRTLYTRVNLRPLDLKDFNVPTLELPDTQSNPRNEIEFHDDYEDEEFISPEQISANLITLSNLPTSRWQNLLDLDTIKRRNAPKAPPKAPKAAPFFLPTTAGLDLAFQLPDAGASGASKILPAGSFSDLTPFGRALSAAEDEADYVRCFETLKSLGPSAIDYEVTGLGPERGGSEQVMVQFLKAIECVLVSNRDFELAQSYLSLFLKVHGKIVVDSEPLLDALESVDRSRSTGWERLQEMLFYNLCTVKSIKNM